MVVWVSVSRRPEIVEEKHVGRLGYDNAAIRENDAGRHADFIGEDREFVGTAIAVSVFTNLDPVVTFASGLAVIGIIDRFRDP